MNKNTVDSTRYAIAAVVHTLVWDATGERILLLERANTGFMDGRHTLPGGHLQAGESFVMAARREVLEETGVELTEIDPCCALPYDGGVNFVFSSNNWRGRPRNAEPTRCAGVDWFRIDELPSTTVFWLAKVLELRESGHWFYDFIEK